MFLLVSKSKNLLEKNHGSRLMVTFSSTSTKLMANMPGCCRFSRKSNSFCVSTTVALHQTSDSFIHAQMAKTGWKDRAPYMNSPETDALLSTAQGTNNYVDGKRPSLMLGVSSPTWFGSDSNALYSKDATFKVPDMPTGTTTDKLPEYTATEMDNLSGQYSHDIKTLVREKKISEEDAQPVNDAISAYKKEPTRDNFKALSILQFTAKETIPALNRALEGSDISEDNKKIINDALGEYRQNQSTENFANLLKAYEITQPIQPALAKNKSNKKPKR